jgi:hypothetical protein
LQRASGHADDLGDLVSALSPLYEVADLLYFFWRKLGWSSATQGLRGELNELVHFSTPRYPPGSAREFQPTDETLASCSSRAA